jgi:hypothetical protein
VDASLACRTQFAIDLFRHRMLHRFPCRSDIAEAKGSSA